MTKVQQRSRTCESVQNMIDDIGVDLDTTQPMIKLSRNTPLPLILHVIQGHAKQLKAQLSGVCHVLIGKRTQIFSYLPEVTSCPLGDDASDHFEQTPRPTPHGQQSIHCTSLQHSINMSSVRKIINSCTSETGQQLPMEEGSCWFMVWQRSICAPS